MIRYSALTTRAPGLGALLSLLLLAGCGDDPHHCEDGHIDEHCPGPDAAPADAPDVEEPVPHTLFVAHDDKLVAFDIATGQKRPGELIDVITPVDMQALASGHIVTNLTERNEVLIVNARTLADTRVPSSSIGGTRPVHLYLSPVRDGAQYMMTLNDGVADTLATNSALFIDIAPDSPTFLQVIGETPLGLGHHKAAFSPNVPRVSVSNINDCELLIEVLDYAGPANITRLGSLTGAEAGVGEEGRPCDGTGRPSPHGGATAHATGRSYHNFTGWGMIAAVDQEATPPTFELLPTSGTGAGYTKGGKDGRYVYSLQRTPREGDATRPGATCQIGNLVVIDGEENRIAAEVPILYRGGDCAESILETEAERAGPGHILVSQDGSRLFITTAATPPPDGTASADQQLVFDLSDPASPVQLASIPIGASSGRRAQTLSGDGKYLFVTNNTAGTVSQIDTDTLEVVRTLEVGEDIRQLATYGTDEGPGAQQGPL